MSNKCTHFVLVNLTIYNVPLINALGLGCWNYGIQIDNIIVRYEIHQVSTGSGQLPLHWKLGIGIYRYNP